MKSAALHHRPSGHPVKSPIRQPLYHVPQNLDEI